MKLRRIVSGGQTGVDRGALDAAIAGTFPCGGWCPEGRKAEDGPIPDHYPLKILAGAGYRQRTLKNLQDSDATLILHDGEMSGGTKLTQDWCVREAKPVIALDAATYSVAEAVATVLRFVEHHEVETLNVAGPRASRWALGQAFARDVIAGVIAAPGADDPA